MGKYDTITPRAKKPIGNYKLNSPNCAFSDFVIWHAQQVPAAYNSIEVEKYKSANSPRVLIKKPLKDSPEKWRVTKISKEPAD